MTKSVTLEVSITQREIQAQQAENKGVSDFGVISTFNLLKTHIFKVLSNQQHAEMVDLFSILNSRLLGR